MEQAPPPTKPRTPVPYEPPAVHPPPPAEHIMQFFSYDHLPSKLQAVSRPFGELAQELVTTLPRNPERTIALRKLLEAKDAAVRALLAVDPIQPSKPPPPR